VCGNVCGDTVSTSFFVLPWPGSQRGRGNIKTLETRDIEIKIRRKMRNKTQNSGILYHGGILALSFTMKKKCSI